MGGRLRVFGIGLLAAAALAGCASSEFSTLVRAAASEPGVRRQRVPMLGLARTTVRVMHPQGVRDFQMAVFETDGSAASERLDLAIAEVGRGWTPMIRVASADGERSTVWARTSGSGMEMLVLARDGEESVIVRFEMDADRFFATLAGSPATLADTDPVR
ncbi:MAG TPA: hypothetical protein VGF40_19590 [Thermoanaerobaculia bacterium]